MSEPGVFRNAMSQLTDANILRHEDQDDLDAAIEERFRAEMDRVEMPDDEEAANEAMTRVILELMDHAFKSGLVYGAGTEDDETRAALRLSPEQATAVVAGLLGNGVTFKVDRG